MSELQNVAILGLIEWGSQLDRRPQSTDRTETRVIETGRPGGISKILQRDRGVTFVEILITIVLMGTVVLALLAATRTAISASATSREVARIESALVAAANAIDRAELACNSAGNNLVLSSVTAAVEGAYGSVASPTVDVWAKHSYRGGSWTDDDCGPYAAVSVVQKFIVTVTSPDGAMTRDIEVVKSNV